MFARIARSWMIFKNSLSVLNRNKKLLVFPLLSAGFVIVIALLIFSGIFAVMLANPQLVEKMSKTARAQQQQTTFSKVFASNPDAPLTVEKSVQAGEHSDTQQYALLAGKIVVLFIAYFVSVFLATFFNVAFYSEIIHGLNSEPVSLIRGFKFAFAKRASIAMWALLGATVGMVLKALEERFGWLGRLVIRFIGLAWNVVTVFAVPVIICEGDSFNPIKNVKKSAAVIKNTWGESLVGFLGISAISGLLIIPIILLTAILAIAVGMLVNIVLAIIIGVLGVIAMIAVTILLDVAQKIYIASLYLYATTGFLNAAYDENLMQNPWKVKR